MSDLRFDRLDFKKSVKEADFFGKTALWLSVGFGVGLLPRAPGTFGTLVAIPLVLAIHFLNPVFSAGSLVFFIALAVWASDRGEKILGRPDPREIVIDEMAGFLVTLFLLPLTWGTLALGFFLFRIFDILKPFPIRWFEGVKGGRGIVLDDLMAGLYGNLVLRFLLELF